MKKSKSHTHYSVTERVYVSKKTGEKYLLHSSEARIDTDTPVERDLSGYKSVGRNNAFEIYEKTTWAPYNAGRDPNDLGGTGHGDISYSDADPGL